MVPTNLYMICTWLQLILYDKLQNLNTYHVEIGGDHRHMVVQDYLIISSDSHN